MIYHGTLIFVNCTEVRHDGKTCETFKCCANGKADQTSYARSCLIWIRENKLLSSKKFPKFPYPV